jgi:hypothetical protein
MEQRVHLLAVPDKPAVLIPKQTMRCADCKRGFYLLNDAKIVEGPFVNLPETGRSRWGESLTAEKIKQCVWVEPKLSARIEFLERTEAGRLWHSRFVRLDD